MPLIWTNYDEPLSQTSADGGEESVEQRDSFKHKKREDIGIYVSFKAFCVWFVLLF